MNGKGRINGGLLFAKNTNFTRSLFADMMDAHMQGGLDKPRVPWGTMKCGSNEQLCFNGLKNRKIFVEKVLIASGKTYNRGGCVLFKCGAGGGPSDPSMNELRLRDPSLEIMHFMGSSKSGAAKEMCDSGVNVTGEGPLG